MPSPVAHCALALAALPLVCSVRATPRAMLAHSVFRLRVALPLGVAAVICVLPDLDIAVNLLRGLDAFRTHGTWTHSVLWAPFGGVLLALAARGAGLRGVTTRAALLGTALLASHALLDMVTRGRGAAVLWPIVPGRVRPPVELFVGVRHSEPGNLGAHAVTLGTEAVFAIVVWAIVMLIPPVAGAERDSRGRA